MFEFDCGGAWLRCSGGRSRGGRPPGVVVTRRGGSRGSLGGRFARPLGEGVRPWRGDRGLYGLGADGGEHGVEAGGELGVAVVDEKSKVAPGVFEVGGEVASHLVDPGTGGIGGDTEQTTKVQQARHRIVVLEASGLSHAEIAHRARVSGSTVSSLIGGVSSAHRRPPSPLSWALSR